MALFEIAPILAPDDGANRCRRNAEFVAQRGVSGVSRLVTAAYFAHLAFRKFVARVIFSLRYMVAPFARAIPHIVGMRSEKKVIWTDAARLIAAVEAMKLIGDWAVMQLPREAMGALRNPVYSHFPVSGGASATSPEPATLRLADALPKPLRPGASWPPCSLARHAAKTPVALVDLRRADEKPGAALFANSGDGMVSRHHGPFVVSRSGRLLPRHRGFSISSHFSIGMGFTLGWKAT